MDEKEEGATQMGYTNRGVEGIEEVKRVASKEEKSKFLSDWAMAHPLSTIREAREALLHQFGITMGTAYISETLRIARQVHEENSRNGIQLATQPVEMPRTPQGILILVRTMRVMGIKKIEITSDGTFTYEAEGKI